MFFLNQQSPTWKMAVEIISKISPEKKFIYNAETEIWKRHFLKATRITRPWGGIPHLKKKHFLCSFYFKSSRFCISQLPGVRPPPLSLAEYPAKNARFLLFLRASNTTSPFVAWNRDNILKFICIYLDLFLSVFYVCVFPSKILLPLFILWYILNRVACPNLDIMSELRNIKITP